MRHINIIIDEELFGVSEMIHDLKHRDTNASFSMSFREPITMSQKKKKDCMIKFNAILKNEEVDFQTDIKAKYGIICPMNTLKKNKIIRGIIGFCMSLFLTMYAEKDLKDLVRRVEIQHDGV